MDVFSSCVIDSSSVKVIALRAFAWPLLASLYISSALKASTEIGGRETCILSQWPFPMALSINNNETPPNRLPPAPSTVASKQFSFTKQIERERERPVGKQKKQANYPWHGHCLCHNCFPCKGT